MTVEEKIKKLEEEKSDYLGKECEVYSRIVGYVRPVKMWNEGKQEEYKNRVMYSV